MGAGFGGLELSTRLSEELGDKIQVTLIDASDHFVFGYAKLDVMFGRESSENSRCYYKDIIKNGVEFRQETVISIDPESKKVATNIREYNPDVLVVALGADMDIDATPGLAEFGNEFYTPNGAEVLREEINNFEAGVVVIGVMGEFFKCPPAPCEAAFMLHDEFVRRGIIDRTKIILVSSLSSPVPLSEEMSFEILERFEKNNIEFVPSADIVSVNGPSRSLQLADGSSVPFDLLLAVPIHKAPEVVAKSKISTNGWIEVDPRTLETSFDNVYAIGDVTETKVPRAGVFSEGQAKTVASRIISKYKNETAKSKYDGDGTCYVEFGDGDVAQIEVNFLSGPKATGAFRRPSKEFVPQKASFGSTRRNRWFGK